MQDPNTNTSIYDAVNLLSKKTKTIADFAAGQQILAEYRIVRLVTKPLIQNS